MDNRGAIQVSEVTKAFGNRKALDSVSFELGQGGFLSVFGPNGAGKTTLLRILATLEKPTAGTVTVAGCDVRKDSDDVRARVGFISHQSMLYPDLTPSENLMLYARLYGVENPKKRVSELISSVGLSLRAFEPVRTFSRGMVQRAAIARALINDPEILLLDEPYSGLDPRASSTLDELLENMKRSRTCVLVSHDVSRGFELCTHAMIMSRGQVVATCEKGKTSYEEFLDLYKSVLQMGVA